MSRKFTREGNGEKRRANFSFLCTTRVNLKKKDNRETGMPKKKTICSKSLHEPRLKSQQFLKTKQNRNNYRTNLCDREKQKNNYIFSTGRDTKGSFAQLKCFSARLKSPLIEINCANAPPKHELFQRRARSHVRAVTHV